MQAYLNKNMENEVVSFKFCVSLKNSPCICMLIYKKTAGPNNRSLGFV